MRMESRASECGRLRCMRVHSLFISVKLRSKKLTETLAAPASGSTDVLDASAARDGTDEASSTARAPGCCCFWWVLRLREVVGNYR